MRQQQRRDRHVIHLGQGHACGMQTEPAVKVEFAIITDACMARKVSSTVQVYYSTYADAWAVSKWQVPLVLLLLLPCASCFAVRPQRGRRCPVLRILLEPPLLCTQDRNPEPLNDALPGFFLLTECESMGKQGVQSAQNSTI